MTDSRKKPKKSKDQYNPTMEYLRRKIYGFTVRRKKDY